MSVEPAQIQAVVIGIEQYDQGDLWELNGPASDVRRFVRWLRGRDVKPENIHVFLSTAPSDPDLQQQSDPDFEHGTGIQIRSATAEAIRTFLFRELPQKGGSVLYFFWSGHGFLDRERRRRVYFADAVQNDLRNLCVDELMVRFAGMPFAPFRKQVFLFDACANPYYAGAEPHPEQLPDPSPVHPGIEQFALFASSDGEIANFDRITTASSRPQVRGGLFADALLEELESTPDTVLLPDLNAVTARVMEKVPARARQLDRSDQRPVHVHVRPWGSPWSSEIVGPRSAGWDPVLSCDRTIPTAGFRRFMTHARREPELSACVVMGDMTQCVDSFVKRLVNESLVAEAKGLFSVPSPLINVAGSIQWELADQDTFEKVWGNRLLKAFGGVEVTAPRVADLGLLPEFRNYQMLVLRHSLTPAALHRRTLPLLVWYLKDWWAPLYADAESARHVLIIFELTLRPCARPWSLAEAARRWEKLFCEFRLKRLAKRVPGCRMDVLQELESVPYEEVAGWLAEHVPDSDDVARNTLMAEVMGRESRSPMVRVQEKLREFLRNHRSGISQQGAAA